MGKVAMSPTEEEWEAIVLEKVGEKSGLDENRLKVLKRR